MTRGLRLIPDGWLCSHVAQRLYFWTDGRLSWGWFGSLRRKLWQPLQRRLSIRLETFHD